MPILSTQRLRHACNRRDLSLRSRVAKEPPSQCRIVKGGKVTLEGVVDNEGDKNMANIRANSVSGVFSVTNNLQVVKN